MLFIILLGLSAAALAGSAAYFSVHGLAVTFSGVYWGVVMMGGAVEAGKLMAASYLYRYWKQTTFFMKTYMILGIVVVMAMTSAGIFGYLSAGYQTGMLPMKIIQEQIANVEQERSKLNVRKVEVDELLVDANRTTDINLNTAAGRIDARAVNTLKQIEEARQAKVSSIEPERDYLNDRIRTLDAEILALKKSALEHEANIGPIMYIAEVFSIDPQQAAKYLIFLIIFAFDPMAIALTLAVNIALRERARQKEVVSEDAKTPPIIDEPVPQPKPEPESMPKAEPLPELPVPEPLVPVAPTQPMVLETPELVEQEQEPLVVEQVIEPEIVPIAEPSPSPEPPVVKVNPMVFSSTLANIDDPEVIIAKLDWYHSTMDRVKAGATLTHDEDRELAIILRLLTNTKHHYLVTDRNAYNEFRRKLDNI